MENKEVDTIEVIPKRESDGANEFITIYNEGGEVLHKGNQFPANTIINTTYNELEFISYPNHRDITITWDSLVNYVNNKVE